MLSVRTIYIVHDGLQIMFLFEVHLYCLLGAVNVSIFFNEVSTNACQC